MTCQLTGVISVSLICIHEVAKLPQEGAEESKVIKHLKLGYLCFKIEYKCSFPEILLFPLWKTCRVAERCVSVNPKWYSQHCYGTGYTLWIERGMGHQKGRIPHQRLWAALWLPTASHSAQPSSSCSFKFCEHLPSTWNTKQYSVWSEAHLGWVELQFGAEVMFLQ